jgi:hypothetical protein
VDIWGVLAEVAEGEEACVGVLVYRTLGGSIGKMIKARRDKRE